MADGRLADAELKAIRGRAEAATPGPWTWEQNVYGGAAGVHAAGQQVATTYHADAGAGVEHRLAQGLANAAFVAHARADVPALLAHADALAADLAAAEGALADLCSPESGEANAAYLRGVEDGVRRCVGVLRKEAGQFRDAAANYSFLPVKPAEARAIARALDDSARALESPPAPAATPGGE